MQGSFTIAKNQDVRFRIVDHEDVVRLYLDGFLQPLMTLAVTNRPGDRIALYNANGTVARTAYPTEGSYFVRWGNAVTVLFAALPANQVSLVTAIDGDGRVASAPGGNTFTL